MSEALDILVMSGPYDGESHRLNAPRDPTRGYVLGRRPECDLAFAYDDWVSGQHARLYQNGPAWFVEDLNSTNRTHVGRTRRDGTFAGRELAVGPMPIADGQLIQLGRLWIRVRFVQ